MTTIHQSPVGTYHAPSDGSWSIQDTRGYADPGPSCSECYLCECEADCPCQVYNACDASQHDKRCGYGNVGDYAIECVGLSFVYVNQDDGSESLCEDCAIKAGITITQCNCKE